MPVGGGVALALAVILPLRDARTFPADVPADLEPRREERVDVLLLGYGRAGPALGSGCRTHGAAGT